MICGPAELAVKLRSIFQDRSNRFSVADEIGREGSKDPHDSFRARKFTFYNCPGRFLFENKRSSVKLFKE